MGWGNPALPPEIGACNLSALTARFARWLSGVYHFSPPHTLTRQENEGVAYRVGKSDTPCHLHARPFLLRVVIAMKFVDRFAKTRTLAHIFPH